MVIIILLLDCESDKVSPLGNNDVVADVVLKAICFVEIMTVIVLSDFMSLADVCQTCSDPESCPA